MALNLQIIVGEQTTFSKLYFKILHHNENRTILRLID